MGVGRLGSTPWAEVNASLPSAEPTKALTIRASRCGFSASTSASFCTRRAEIDASFPVVVGGGLGKEDQPLRSCPPWPRSDIPTGYLGVGGCVLSAPHAAHVPCSFGNRSARPWTPGHAAGLPAPTYSLGCPECSGALGLCRISLRLPTCAQCSWCGPGDLQGPAQGHELQEGQNWTKPRVLTPAGLWPHSRCCPWVFSAAPGWGAPPSPALTGAGNFAGTAREVAALLMWGDRPQHVNVKSLSCCKDRNTDREERLRAQEEGPAWESFSHREV